VIDAEQTLAQERAELHRLTRFLTRPGPAYGLSMALYRDPVIARGLQAELVARLRREGKEVAYVELTHDDATSDLAAQIEGASGQADVVFVLHLDRLLLDSAGRPKHTSAVANLNQSRDSLPERLPARIVLWISMASHESFRDQARDLRQYVLSIAEFGRQAIIPTVLRGVEELPDWLRFAPPAELEARRNRAETLARAAAEVSDRRGFADAAASAGRAFAEATEFEDAATWLERAVGAYTELDAFAEASTALGRLAELSQYRGDSDLALTQATRAVELASRSGDVSLQASHKGKLSDILISRGELDEALRSLQTEQIPTYERLGDVRSLAITWGQVADILQLKGNLDDALRIQQQQITTYERLGDIHSLAITWGQVADILQLKGNLDAALRIQQQQISIFERLGDIHSLAVTWGKIADILYTKGKLDEALRIRRQHETPVFERLEDVRSLSIAREKIADILHSKGELDEAIRIRRQQIPVYERIGDVRSLLVGQVNLVINLRERGHSDDLPEIIQLLAAALQAARKLDIPEAAKIESLIRELDLDPDTPPFTAAT